MPHSAFHENEHEFVKKKLFYEVVLCRPPFLISRQSAAPRHRIFFPRCVTENTYYSGGHWIFLCRAVSPEIALVTLAPFNKYRHHHLSRLKDILRNKNGVVKENLIIFTRKVRARRAHADCDSDMIFTRR